MAQSDIYDLLKTKRLSGDDSFFTGEQIRKMLKEKNICTNSTSIDCNLKKLRQFGFLEFNFTNKKNTVIGINRYAYRLKKDYL